MPTTPTAPTETGPAGPATATPDAHARPDPPDAPDAPDALPAYTVAVRELCAFAAKAGDLDLRFTPAPTSQEGIAGHQTVVARRGPGYRAEVALAGRYQHLQVRGRADGFDAETACVEEIKTHKGDLALQPDNHRALHWAQAKVYGWLLCQAHGLARIQVALVYLHVGTQTETRLAEDCSAEALRVHFEALCVRFVGWADAELAHRAARDQGLRGMPFVHGAMREGQRTLAEQVYHAARTGRCLMAQAPTGIGKTLGTLFPLLKAGPRLDKVFYLSAKGSGRTLAVQALADVRRHAPTVPLRVLELVSRERACVHPDRVCHGDSCPLAQGFYDRLPAARQAAVDTAAGQGLALNAAAHGGAPATRTAAAPLLDAAQVQTTALAHAVCPYYLSQELVRWADVVVGDVNYFFDISALLHGLQQANGWQVAVLVDEAHNLLDRARTMYSASLRQPEVRALARQHSGPLKKALQRFHRAWLALNRGQVSGQPGGLADAAEPPHGGAAQPAAAYQVLPELPGTWLQALQDLVQAIGDHLAEQQQPGRAASAAPADPALMAFYFDALLFGRLAEQFGPHSMADLSALPAGRGGRAPDTALAIRNLLPAPFLAPRFAATRTTVLFSATLSPPQFYANTLGLPESTAWLDVAGPFRAEQLAVHLVPGVSTRYQARARSCQPIADLMARQFAAEPGNYLAFFSSFDYLAQVAAVFAQRHPQLPHWLQHRGMDDAARQAFIDRFAPDGQGIGFAVLGGVFGEGIDLPGRRLIGAFIATLGLPQFNPVNEQMRQRMQAAFAAGYDYTYLYPGLRKVVQAAGRVIRTPDDRGTLYLIDDRFIQPEVQALLPGWWQPRVLAGPA